MHVLAAHRCGPVELVDIGLGPELPDPHAVVLGEADVAARWPVPGPADDKYTQGVTGVAAGSATYPGAAVLASGAAVLATSGMVRYSGSAADLVRARWPEVVATDEFADAARTQSWAVGPGIGTDDAGRALLAAVLDRDVPVCIDADGVTLLGGHADLRSAIAGRPVVLTPHDREFARVAGEVGPDRHRGSPSGGGSAAGDGAAQGQRHRRRRPGRPHARASVDDVVGGDGGIGRRADRDRRRAAGRRAGSVVGGGLRRVRARPAAEIAADGAPVPSSAIQQAIPAAIRSVRARPDRGRRTGRLMRIVRQEPNYASIWFDSARSAAVQRLAVRGCATRADGRMDAWPIPVPRRVPRGARAEAVVDLAAVRHNVAVLAAAAPGAALMAVVKADGYGHGAVPVARAALDAGATWLGVCTLDEALALRGAGIDAPLLSWLRPAGRGLRARRVAAGSTSPSASRAHLAAVADGARRAGRPARVHLKVDTGLSRNGAVPDDWPDLLDAREGRCRRRVEVVAVWSHLAHADSPATRCSTSRPRGSRAWRRPSTGGSRRSGTSPTPRPP